MNVLQKYNLPKFIKVHVEKGESGALLAELSDLGVYTQADTLNELFLQVNDLVYTFYDVLQKDQDAVKYIPSRSAQEDLVRLASSRQNVNQNFRLNQYVLPPNQYGPSNHGYA